MYFIRAQFQFVAEILSCLVGDRSYWSKIAEQMALVLNKESLCASFNTHLHAISFFTIASYTDNKCNMHRCLVTMV